MNSVRGGRKNRLCTCVYVCVRVSLSLSLSLSRSLCLCLCFCLSRSRSRSFLLSVPLSLCLSLSLSLSLCLSLCRPLSRSHWGHTLSVCLSVCVYINGRPLRQNQARSCPRDQYTLQCQHRNIAGTHTVPGVALTSSCNPLSTGRRNRVHQCSSSTTSSCYLPRRSGGSRWRKLSCCCPSARLVGLPPRRPRSPT